MEVIIMESEAFYKLLNEVVERVMKKLPQDKPEWIGTDEAMAMLQIKSKTTLQKLRDSGAIEFSQLSKRIILYNRKSLLEFIQQSNRKL